MTVDIEITTKPPDLFRRFDRYPAQLDAEINRTMEQALLHVQGSVLPYPPYQSSYVRTGQLGRSLTRGGGENVFDNKKLGQGDYEATFGTNLEYAKWVIGDETQARHMGHWWKMSAVAAKAKPGIIRLFDAAMQRLANWIAGR